MAADWPALLDELAARSEPWAGQMRALLDQVRRDVPWIGVPELLVAERGRGVSVEWRPGDFDRLSGAILAIGTGRQPSGLWCCWVPRLTQQSGRFDPAGGPPPELVAWLRGRVA